MIFLRACCWHCRIRLQNVPAKNNRLWGLVCGLETYLTKKDTIFLGSRNKTEKDALLHDKDDEITKLRTEVARKDQLRLVNEKKICYFLCK